MISQASYHSTLPTELLVVLNISFAIKVLIVRQFYEIPNIIVFHSLHLIIHGINHFLKLQTSFDLGEVDKISLHYPYVKFVLLEIYDITIWISLLQTSSKAFVLEIVKFALQEQFPHLRREGIDHYLELKLHIEQCHDHEPKYLDHC